MAVLKRKQGLRYLRNKIVLALPVVILFFCILRLINEVIPTEVEKSVTTTRSTVERKPLPQLLLTKNYISKVTADHFVPKCRHKIDWHNHGLIKKDLERVGLGEQGSPANIVPSQEEDKIKKEELFFENGYDAYLSMHIALDRSLPDLRHKGCRSKLYLESLPTVSVVVPFHNEHWSTLLRTVYSVMYRTPPQLLKEIFLVDDASTELFLQQRLDNFVTHNLPKVEVIRLNERSGVVTARLAGAKKVTADVIVFLDAHTEATHNWLPPLLEPIALNYRTAVCPYIGVIAYDTFKFWMPAMGVRGGFNWDFFYERLPMLPKDLNNLPEPFESPIMGDGIFAISYKFFWELGGYDPGLMFWGGEYLELSFKIWMCGGRILNAPCSTVGHVYKNHSNFHDPGIGGYLGRNHRRIAEVWMDEYAQYLYNRKPYLVWVEPGDLSAQKDIRKKLKCKSFRWFMTQIAFDVAVKFPPVDPEPYASGRIRPVSHPDLCIDAHNGTDWDKLLLTPCVNTPSVEQKFVFGWLKDIKSQYRNKCWDLPDPKPRSPVQLFFCHGEQRNQYWRYLPDKKLIVHIKSNECLASDPPSHSLFIDICDDASKKQQWIVDKVNKEMMDKWERNNLMVTGPEKSYDEVDN